MLRVVYAFFLGLILVLFVGLGTATFYRSPEPPVYPSMQVVEKPTNAELEAQQALQRQYDVEFAEYQKASDVYHRNVSIITLIASVILLSISTIWAKRNSLLANGIMLGGLFTLIYSITRGVMSQYPEMTFIAVAVGLVTVLILGNRRFFGKKSPSLGEGV